MCGGVEVEGGLAQDFELLYVLFITVSNSVFAVSYTHLYSLNKFVSTFTFLLMFKQFLKILLLILYF